MCVREGAHKCVHVMYATYFVARDKVSHWNSPNELES